MAERRRAVDQGNDGASTSGRSSRSTSLSGSVLKHGRVLVDMLSGKYLYDLYVARSKSQ